MKKLAPFTTPAKAYCPTHDYQLPNLDLLSLIFESPEALSNEDTVLHVEAAVPENSINKAQARAYTKTIAYQLRHMYGVGQNGPGKDVVVCMSSGQVLLPIIFYAVIAAGGVYSAASTAFTSFELSRQINQGQSRLIITSADCRDVALKSAKECGVPPERVLVLESNNHERLLQDVTGYGPNLVKGNETLSWPVITDPEELDSRLICLLYSSGTTGVPKGVKLSHRNLASPSLVVEYMNREYISRQRQIDPSFEFEYRSLAYLPPAHVAGCSGYFINAAIAGGIVYWMPKFDFAKFLENMKKFRISFLMSVPAIYLQIAKNPSVSDQLSSVTRAIAGASPMGPELQQEAEKKLPYSHIAQMWGMSETSGTFTSVPWGQPDVTGSVGALLPNCRLRIVDDNLQDVPEGAEGEFLVKGPLVFKGYFRDESATRDSFTADGWFKTGDIGVRRNGLFYIIDRKKELIKYKGLQVSPSEIEALLISRQGILDAAVIGVPSSDGSGNELPRAYVVADPASVSDQAIYELVSNNLAHHKQLRGGIVRLDAIPKNASGKILRRELRKMVKEQNVPKL